MVRNVFKSNVLNDPYACPDSMSLVGFEHSIRGLGSFTNHGQLEFLRDVVHAPTLSVPPNLDVMLRSLIHNCL